jgi:hypothetical protein
MNVSQSGAAWLSAYYALIRVACQVGRLALLRRRIPGYDIVSIPRIHVHKIDFVLS